MPTFSVTGFDGGSNTTLGLGIIGLYSLTDLLTFQAGIGAGTNRSNFGVGTFKTSGINLGLGVLVPVRIFENDKNSFVISPNIGINFFKGRTGYEDPNFPTTNESLNTIFF